MNLKHAKRNDNAINDNATFITACEKIPYEKTACQKTANGFKFKNKNRFFIFFPITVIIFSAVCIFFFGLKNYNDVKKYYPAVIEYSKKSNINPALAFAVIRAESGFDKNAKSKKGALGLMQIMPETASYIAEMCSYGGKIDLLDPDCNIKLGCCYLSYLLNKFEIEKVAVCAYNAGETKVTGWLKNRNYSSDGKDLIKIPYAETREYCLKVEKYKNRYENYLKRIKRKGYHAKIENKRQSVCFFETNALAFYSGDFTLCDRRRFVSDLDII